MNAAVISSDECCDELLCLFYADGLVLFIKMSESKFVNCSVTNIIKDLFFKEINFLTEDKHKESGLYMISWIAQLKDN